MVTKRPKGLGRGLEALLGPKVEEGAEAAAANPGLPASLLLANKPLQGLDGVPLQEMDEDDLNLVIDTISKFHEKRKATGTLSSRGLEWLVAIIATAKDVLAERSGPAPEEGA